MSLITAVRSQASVPAPMSPTRQDPVARTAAVEAAQPVTAPMRKDAVGQASMAAASVAARLAERDESRHPAAEARIAAEAAREAYIQASIAAGVNPLPLP